MRWGARGRGWRRVWLPSYYCPEVPAALAALETGGVELRAYPDHDLAAPPAVERIPVAAGDVVVVANQLGVRPTPATNDLAGRGAIVVEDHSHDPGSAWARSSRADYAFASLRKTLPIPDGGVVWSPGHLDTPPEPPVAGADAERAGERLAAALRRRDDRVGADDRLRFRALARSGAGRAAPATPSRIAVSSRALLPHMPVEAWRDRRRRNHEALVRKTGILPRARVLPSPPGGVSFAFTIVFDAAEDRALAARVLAGRAVAPVVLWPLDPARDRGVGAEDADLSRRIVSVSCDQRYDDADTDRLAVVLRAVLRA